MENWPDFRIRQTVKSSPTKPELSAPKMQLRKDGLQPYEGTRLHTTSSIPKTMAQLSILLETIWN